jgi:hypothetical protein
MIQIISLPIPTFPFNLFHAEPLAAIFLQSVITIFSAQTELIKIYKMIMKYMEKYAVREIFQRPHCPKSMKNFESDETMSV